MVFVWLTTMCVDCLSWQEEGRQFSGEGPQFEVHGTGASVFDQERMSFVQWILSLLGYSPTKPPVHPPPEPIDQSKCTPCSKYYCNQMFFRVIRHICSQKMFGFSSEKPKMFWLQIWRYVLQELSYTTIIPFVFIGLKTLCLYNVDKFFPVKVTPILKMYLAKTI